MKGWEGLDMGDIIEVIFKGNPSWELLEVVRVKMAAFVTWKTMDRDLTHV